MKHYSCAILKNTPTVENLFIHNRKRKQFYKTLHIRRLCFNSPGCECYSPSSEVEVFAAVRLPEFCVRKSCRNRLAMLFSRNFIYSKWHAVLGNHSAFDFNVEPSVINQKQWGDLRTEQLLLLWLQGMTQSLTALIVFTGREQGWISYVCASGASGKRAFTTLP